MHLEYLKQYLTGAMEIAKKCVQESSEHSYNKGYFEGSESAFQFAINEIDKLQKEQSK